MDTLQTLGLRLSTLTVFRALLCDPVLVSLRAYLDAPSPGAYAAFVSALYAANGGHLGGHLRALCENDENVYVRAVGRGEDVPCFLRDTVEAELACLQEISALTPETLRAPLAFDGFLPSFASGGVCLAEEYRRRAADIGRYGYGIYANNRMFSVSDGGAIVPVRSPDRTTLADLVDYERERGLILDNTRALLAGRPAANILLTGDAGTGKSSTIKAVANALYPEGLRIVELRKDQLRAIPQVLDELADNPLKFILFIDDLSFLRDDDNFNALKAVLEGSVTAKSKNVAIYATSNRRHLVRETFSDREGDEVHRNDTMQEMISLSDRFGLHITFSKPGRDTYLHIVRHLASESGLSLPDAELEARAERFALERGGRSARLARQFVDGLLSRENP
ncbi:MAG: ATP-binding protein [Clostridiaceae bacterium]|nr:ATP-binding protein [Clostridiaceae bacterium]